MFGQSRDFVRLDWHGGGSGMKEILGVLIFVWVAQTPASLGGGGSQADDVHAAKTKGLERRGPSRFHDPIRLPRLTHTRGHD